MNINIKEIASHIFKKDNIEKLLTTIISSSIIFFFSNKEIFEGVWFFDKIYSYTSGYLKIIIISIAILINSIFLFLPIVTKDIEIETKNKSIERLNSELEERNRNLEFLNNKINDNIRLYVLNLNETLKLENSDRITIYAKLEERQEGVKIIFRYSGDIHHGRYNEDKTYNDLDGIIGKTISDGFHIDFNSPVVKSKKKQKRKDEIEAYKTYHKETYSFDTSSLTTNMFPCRFISKSLKDSRGETFVIILIEGDRENSLSHIHETSKILNSFKDNEKDEIIISLIEQKRVIHKFVKTQSDRNNPNVPQIGE